MREIHVPITDWTDPARIAAHVERQLDRLGLSLTMKGTQRAYVGCTHWHYKRAHEPGTLELTLWPAQQRLWIKVHARRTAPWIERLVPELARQLAC